MAIDVIQLECKENKTRNPSSSLTQIHRCTDTQIHGYPDTRIPRDSVVVVVVFVGGGFYCMLCRQPQQA
ncbi:GL20617 [Drosophila persimilis]|uniref:GL20617 n=1 Tax=Drosophila persimilis TaxID=7234 RepID=B4HCS9_DROPE|nr:GL20617 [Drosophila persimilis]